MKPELLSPAGSPEALKAAIALGADAIYLGASAHGARASAGFDDEALKKAIDLAHLYGRRVYVTVNTLLKQTELGSVLSLLDTVTHLRADAVIVQDLGLIKLIKERYPELCVHASTQLSVHNARGAQNLLDLGVSRVVLARECTMEDIRQVARTGIETEVFVHGAMCVSVSGQCLFSSQIGGRSGNRGKCAQTCRLQYRYKDSQGALLSMHDMNTLEHLPELLDAGVSSFKIEGRLKRAEYVAIVTGAYKKALNQAVSGQPQTDFVEEQAELSQIFSRGFTAGHPFSEQDSLLIGAARVSHLGIQMGSILSFKPRDGFVLAQAKLTAPLNNGDGLQLRGSLEQDLIYSGPEVSANDIATLRLRKPPRIGDSVYRLQDERQLERARQSAMMMPVLPFKAKLTLNPGEPVSLCVISGKASVTVTGDTVQAAQKQPLSEETLTRLMGKTGGTPFGLEQLDVIAPSPAFMPSAALNAIRRDALSQLEEAVIAAHELPLTRTNSHSFASAGETPVKNQLYALINSEMDPQEIRAAGADNIIVYLNNYRQGHLEDSLKKLSKDDLLLLPRQMSDKDVSRVMTLCRELGLNVLADNFGQIGQIESPATYSGEGIPAWNNEAFKVLKSFGVKSAVLSRELSLKEIEDLDPGLIELILPVYGRTQIMLLNHCPERVNRNLSKNKAGCTFCERGHGVLGQTLVDRMDAEYPLHPTHFDTGCLITLYHHKVQHLSAMAPQMSQLMDLRLLSPENAKAVTAHYAALRDGQTPEPIAPLEPGRTLVGVE